MPYGEKSKQQLLEYSSRAFEFFEQQNVKAVIMACNTTSAVVYDELKDKYNFKLYPLIQSVSKVFSELPINNIGIFATPATIKSHAYSKCINQYNPAMKVYEIDCPAWVKIVENNTIQSPEAEDAIRIKMEEMLKYNVEKIVLGCTHYPYLINQLAKYAQKNIFINPSEAYVNYIKEDLENLGMLNKSNIKGTDSFFVSAFADKFIDSAAMFYQVNHCEII